MGARARGSGGSGGERRWSGGTGPLSESAAMRRSAASALSVHTGRPSRTCSAHQQKASARPPAARPGRARRCVRPHAQAVPHRAARGLHRAHERHVFGGPHERHAARAAVGAGRNREARAKMLVVARVRVCGGGAVERRQALQRAPVADVEQEQAPHLGRERGALLGHQHHAPAYKICACAYLGEIRSDPVGRRARVCVGGQQQTAAAEQARKGHVQQPLARAAHVCLGWRKRHARRVDRQGRVLSRRRHCGLSRAVGAVVEQHQHLDAPRRPRLARGCALRCERVDEVRQARLLVFSRYHHAYVERGGGGWERVGLGVQPLGERSHGVGERAPLATQPRGTSVPNQEPVEPLAGAFRLSRTASPGGGPTLTHRRHQRSASGARGRTQHRLWRASTRGGRSSSP